MVDLQTIGVLMTGVSVSVAAIYYVLTLRTNQRNIKTTLETRQTQLFMDIWKIFSSKEYQKDREQMFYIWSFDDYADFFKKYGPDTNPEDHAKWDALCSHLEGIGVLVRRGMISSELVYDLMYYSIIEFWDRFHPIIEGRRTVLSMPYVFKDVEGLYDEMKRVRDRRRDPSLINTTPQP